MNTNMCELREWETLKARGWDGKLKIEGLRSICLFATLDFFFFFCLPEREICAW